MATTLVEIGQSLFVQLHGGRCGRAQHVLQGRQAGLVLGGQLGLLLLEDGQGEHITAIHRRERSGAGPPGAHGQRQSQAGEVGPDQGHQWQHGRAAAVCRQGADLTHHERSGMLVSNRATQSLILFFTQWPSRDLLNQIKEAKTLSYLKSTDYQNLLCDNWQQRSEL